jgi:hypothetical protein
MIGQFSEITQITDRFVGQHQQSLRESLLSCAELSLLFLNYARAKRLASELVYMVNTNGYPDGHPPEDHVAPVLQNVIIDFAFTTDGVARTFRKENTLPPELTHITEKELKYGRMGYGKFILLNLNEGLVFLESLSTSNS